MTDLWQLAGVTIKRRRSACWRRWRWRWRLSQQRIDMYAYEERLLYIGPHVVFCSACGRTQVLTEDRWCTQVPAMQVPSVHSSADGGLCLLASSSAIR